MYSVNSVDVLSWFCLVIDQKCVSWFFRAPWELIGLYFQMFSFQECCLMFRAEDRQWVILNLNPNIYF